MMDRRGFFARALGGFAVAVAAPFVAAAPPVLEFRSYGTLRSLNEKMLIDAFEGLRTPCNCGMCGGWRR